MSNNHIAIPVKNLDKSKAFYEKLGFKVFNQWEKPDQKKKAFQMKDRSDFIIELVYHPDHKNIKYHELPRTLHIGIAVKNLSRIINRLQKEGIITTIPITKGVSVKKFAFIKDPNGFNIELLEILN